jgi:hypothetical protein
MSGDPKGYNFIRLNRATFTNDYNYTINRIGEIKSVTLVQQKNSSALNSTLYKIYSNEIKNSKVKMITSKYILKIYNMKLYKCFFFFYLDKIHKSRI